MLWSTVATSRKDSNSGLNVLQLLSSSQPLILTTNLNHIFIIT